VSTKPNVVYVYTSFPLTRNVINVWADIVVADVVANAIIVVDAVVVVNVIIVVAAGIAVDTVVTIGDSVVDVIIAVNDIF